MIFHTFSFMQSKLIWYTLIEIWFNDLIFIKFIKFFISIYINLVSFSCLPILPKPDGIIFPQNNSAV